MIYGTWGWLLHLEENARVKQLKCHESQWVANSFESLTARLREKVAGHTRNIQCISCAYQCISRLFTCELQKRHEAAMNKFARRCVQILAVSVGACVYGFNYPVLHAEQWLRGDLRLLNLLSLIPCIVIQCDSLHFISLHYQIQMDNMHKPSLWRVLASLWHHGTFREETLSSLDILGTGISMHIWGSVSSLSGQC